MIEKGCTAVIIKSYAGNEGKIVRVGGYLGKVKGLFYINQWEIDKPIVGHRRITKEPIITFSVDAHQLQRIDSPINEKSKQKEKEVCK